MADCESDVVAQLEKVVERSRIRAGEGDLCLGSSDTLINGGMGLVEVIQCVVDDGALSRETGRQQ